MLKIPLPLKWAIIIKSFINTRILKHPNKDKAKSNSVNKLDEQKDKVVSKNDFRVFDFQLQ